MSCGEWQARPYSETVHRDASHLCVCRFHVFLKPEYMPLTFRIQAPTIVADLGKSKSKDKERKPSLPQGEQQLRRP